MDQYRNQNSHQTFRYNIAIHFWLHMFVAPEILKLLVSIGIIARIENDSPIFQHNQYSRKSKMFRKRQRSNRCKVEADLRRFQVLPNQPVSEVSQNLVSKLLSASAEVGRRL